VSESVIVSESTGAAGGAAYNAALEFLYDRIDYERLARGVTRVPFRLHRTAELMKRLGLRRYLYHGESPASRPPVPLVHIAGTKGKGSTAAMVAAMLSSSGRRTGLYTSPHLHRLEERFRIDGVPCGPDDVVRLVQRVRPVAEALARESAGPPSFFELTTAMAMLHFDASGCEAIVIEVGLGGRLDSTNVFLPSVTAITSIGLDHQNVLGGTLDKIAAEKAGIIKPGVPVVSGVRPGQADLSQDGPDPSEGSTEPPVDPATVIRRVAEERSAPLFLLGDQFDFVAEPRADWGLALDYTARFDQQQRQETRLRLELDLEGRHQGHNAALALALTQLLGDRGVDVPHWAQAAGLSQLRCAGRVERFSLPDGVLGIVDAAHNEDSIGALCRCLEDRARERPISIVFGTSSDKTPSPLLRALGKHADRLYLTRFHGNPRYVPPHELLASVEPPRRAATEILDDPLEACEAALATATPGGVLVVCGSFFLAAETRGWLESRQRRQGKPTERFPERH
jgi:dihydrofolate synthase/folylpolyglutamate synthase